MKTPKSRCPICFELKGGLLDHMRAVHVVKDGTHTLAQVRRMVPRKKPVDDHMGEAAEDHLRHRHPEAFG